MPQDGQDLIDDESKLNVGSGNGLISLVQNQIW